MYILAALCRHLDDEGRAWSFGARRDIGLDWVASLGVCIRYDLMISALAIDGLVIHMNSSC